MRQLPLAPSPSPLLPTACGASPVGGSGPAPWPLRADSFGANGGSRDRGLLHRHVDLSLDPGERRAWATTTSWIWALSGAQRQARRRFARARALLKQLLGAGS